MLKDARLQSGASWNERTCMIEAEPPIWNNIITSWQRSKKFHNKLFPLFDSLGELYDGQITEGKLVFTSIQSTQNCAFIAHEIVDDSSDTEATEEKPEDNQDKPEESINEKVTHQAKPNQRNSISTTREKEAKKPRRATDVAGMMERYIEMRTKQAEEETTAIAKGRAKSISADDFSIKRCISVVNTMQDLTLEERVKAFQVFKDEQNREIFLCADEASRIMWLKMASYMLHQFFMSREK